MFNKIEQGGENVAYDYSKLRGKIVECYGSQASFAKKVELSERTLSLKLNGKIGFTQTDIESFVDALGIKRSEIQSYFFTINVQ